MQRLGQQLEQQQVLQKAGLDRLSGSADTDSSAGGCGVIPLLLVGLGNFVWFVWLMLVCARQCHTPVDEFLMVWLVSVLFVVSNTFTLHEVAVVGLF